MEHTSNCKVADLFFALRLLLLAGIILFSVALVASWAAGLPVWAAPLPSRRDWAAPAKAQAAAPAASTPTPSLASDTLSPPLDPESVAADSATTLVVASPDTSSSPAEEPSGVPAMATSEPVSPSLSTCVEDVQFLADVTVPDGTVFGPHEVFTKTWRVRNAGSCDWAGYRIAFGGGEPMGTEETQPTAGRSVRDQILPHTPAGQELDISVEMVAPGEPGDYAGYWHILAPGGAVRGKLTCVIGVAGPGDDVPAEVPLEDQTLVPLPDLTPAAGEERWIDVDLSEQMLTAYERGTPVHTTLVSTGLPATPTPVGQFRIWVKFRYDDMAGDGYYIEDVPYVMYFHDGYGLHGVTWHGNFGHPMSHGCVNLPTSEAEWLFNWAEVGTLVNIHS